MSNTNDFRVAVLLTAQSRTYKICLPAIKDFFSREKTENGVRWVKTDYFMHTWTTNQWTTKGSDKPRLNHIEYTPADIDLDFINNTLDGKLQAYKVEKYNPKKIHKNWGPGLYSFYKANELKSKFEYDNNFTYDLVIKIRMDQVWYPGEKFRYHDIVQNRFIYTTSPSFRLKNELNSYNLDDVWFFGDSATMNAAALCYKFIGQTVGEPPYKKNQTDYLFTPESLLGPGTMMNRFINLINIQGTKWVEMHNYLVVRKQALDNDWNYYDHYDKLAKLGFNYYSE